MDPRDMITKNVTKSELIGNGKIISDINKAIEEFQLDGMRKQQMGPGKVGHKVGSEGRKALAARFRGQGGDKFDNSACMGAMKGKVGDPGSFCRALEGYSTGGYEATKKPEGEKMGKMGPIQSGVMLEMARRGGRRAAKIAGAVGTVAGGAAGYLLGRRKKKKKEAMVTEGKESKISRAIQFLRRKATLSKPKLKDLVMSGPRDPMRD